VTGLFFEALVEPSQELFDVLGYQTRGQAAGHPTERNIREAN
jgi:hypothetical protein